VANLTGFAEYFLKSEEAKALTEKYRSIGLLTIEKRPVDLNTFIFDKNYIGLSRISPKQAKLLLALDNFNVDDPEIKYEFVVVVGKGGGKDLVSSLANLRFCYRLALEGPPADYTGLDVKLPITILNIATNAEQANSVYFETFKSLGKSIFKKLGCQEKMGEVIFPNKVIAVSGHSEAEGMEGYNLFSCVLDEIAAFKTEAELRGKSVRSSQSAKYLYDMAKSSIKSRFPKTGKIILISYPRFDGDFILQKYEAGLNQKDVYTEFAKTWEFNPYSKEEDFEDERLRDPVQYAAKYLCEPPKAKEAYFQDEARVRAIVNNKLPDPYIQNSFDRLENSFFGKGFEYFIGLDLALRHDRAGLALVHREFIQPDVLSGASTTIRNTKLVIDLLKVWEANAAKEIEFEGIRQFIYLLRDRNFRIKLCLVDSFQSSDLKQILTKSQIPTENKYSCDKGKKVYDTFKDFVNQGRCECVNCKYTDLLLDEILALSLVTNKKIDHTAGGSKDLSDSVALACYAASLDPSAPAWVREW
jgi:hypothetical protein